MYTLHEGQVIPIYKINHSTKCSPLDVTLDSYRPGYTTGVAEPVYHQDPGATEGKWVKLRVNHILSTTPGFYKRTFPAETRLVGRMVVRSLKPAYKAGLESMRELV